MFGQILFICIGIVAFLFVARFVINVILIMFAGTLNLFNLGMTKLDNKVGFDKMIEKEDSLSDSQKSERKMKWVYICVGIACIGIILDKLIH